MRLYFFIAAFFWSIYALYPKPELKFARYTKQDGLVHNYVLSICQDKFGFMWYGTKNGASRFDGIKFKNYTHNKKLSGTIGPGWVNQIVRDRNKNLWFAIAGPGNTFLKYDYEKDVFIDYSYLLRQFFNVPANQSIPVWNLFVDNKGIIWLSLKDVGFVYYDPENEKIQTLKTPLINQGNSIGQVEFVEDSFNNTWFATNSGILIHNNTSNTFKTILHEANDPASLSSNYCLFIYKDSKKDIWIGTRNGLNKVLNQGAEEPAFQRYYNIPGNKNSLSNNIVYDISEGGNNSLYLATLNGLTVIDSTETFYQYHNDEIDDESINSNIVREVFRDKDGGLWLGTSSGIAKLQEKLFSSYSHSEYKNSPSHSKVDFICEATNKALWIATPKGMDLFDYHKKQFQHIVGITGTPRGLSGTPLVVHPDGNKGLWVGAWRQGLSRYNIQTGTVKNHFLGLQSFSADVFTIFTDSKDNTWIGVSGKGVYIYNGRSRDIRLLAHEKSNSKSMSSDIAYCILEDSDSAIWIGTYSGLNKINNLEEGIVTRFLDSLKINHMFQGGNDIIWLASDSGLFSIDIESYRIKKYNTKDKIPNDEILSILEDENKDVWISTSTGLATCKMKGDSIARIILFKPEDGVRAGNFIARSCAKLSGGYMAFGGTEGFTMFDPAEIETDSLLPTLVLTGLKINGHEIIAGQKINNQVVLHSSLLTTHEIVLNYKNNAFAITFTGLQYNKPHYNTYAYKLKGYDPSDSEWHLTNAADREVEYMNLPGGDYVFKVKAANCNGYWNNDPVSLSIKILPPWWKTYWFTALWIGLTISLFFAFFKFRTYQLQKQKQRLKQTVEHRTSELLIANKSLEESKEELVQQAHELIQTNNSLEAKTREVEIMAKKVHEADQSKLRFFANISHEFRTPLTLIMGPLEKYAHIKTLHNVNEWIKISNYLKLALKNTKRLSNLVNQILDFRKLDQKLVSLNITNNNIIEFINEIMNSFSALAESKNIHLIVKSEELKVKNEEISDTEQLITHHSSLFTQFWFDPDIMEKILYNLISNAIKYTPEGGEIVIAIGVVGVETRHALSLQNNQLAIKISDTGIGIPPQHIDKIFDRFYRVETLPRHGRDLRHATSVETHGRVSLHANQIEGTGIGLAYTKELVVLHKGSISVSSEPQKGTEFTLVFPMNLKQGNKDKEALNKLPNSIAPVIIDEFIGSTETNIEDDVDNQSSQSRSNLKLLLVEDNIDLRYYLKNELKDKYIIYEGENGVQGLDMALRVTPDLIISDVMMPEMDGFELCKAIKTNEDISHIPIILLTAKSEDKDTLKGLKTGADDYITKPFNIDILKVKISNLFETRKRLQKKYNNSIFAQPSEVTHSVIDEKFLQKAIQTVKEHIEDPDFDHDSFSEQMNYSKSMVYKKIKALTDQTISEFIRNIRLKEAARLFSEGHDNVTSVCYMVGFKHPSILSRYFSKMFQKTPTQFINEQYK